MFTHLSLGVAHALSGAAMNLRSLLVFVCTVAWCGTAFATSEPKYRMTRPTVDARGYGLPLTSSGRGFGSARGVGATSNPNAHQMGTTYYDFQHNGSTGRQVDEFNGKVEASFMKAPGPSASIRTIGWDRTAVSGAVNSVHPGYVPFGASLLIGTEFEAVRPGFTTLRLRPNGKSVTVYHDAPEQGGLQLWEARLDLTAGNGIFNSTPSTAPVPPGVDHLLNSMIWPKSAISTCGADMVHHAVATWSGGSTEVWYWRGVINDSAGIISWASMAGGVPIKLDNVSVGISAVVEASGSEVTVAMGKQVNSTNADIVFYRSTNCGATWGNRVNVTNYSPTHDEGFFAELNALYDPGGELHLIWNTAPASGAEAPVNLWHWSQTTGERRITSAGWINTCVGGLWPAPLGNGAGLGNLAIAEPTLSVKPAGVYGPDELLYAIWTQYGPTDTDCATVDDQGTLGGYVNAEIYVSVSSDDGLTWDRPQNVTNTQTPDCEPGDCNSEAWVSAAAMADSGVYLSYVDDSHAGPAVLGEGAWSNSPYMVMAIQARAAVLAPVIAVSPLEYIELNANPAGGTNTVDLNIISVGNADLTYTVSVTNVGGGATHLTVNGGASASSTILAGGVPHVITVGYDAAGLPNPSEHNWQLEVTSNDPENNDPGEEILVDLQVFAANPWYPCVNDTVSTGTHRMQVSSCLEMGAQGTLGRGFFNYSDSTDYLYSGSPVISLVRLGDTLAYHNAFMSLPDRTREENKSYRALGPMTVSRNALIMVGDSTYNADRVTGRASTTDTTIEVNYDMIYPKAAHLSNGFVWKFRMRSLTGGAITGVNYGVIADLDVDPSAGENEGVGSDPRGYIGARGGEADTAGNFTPNTKYIALFHLPQGGSCDRSGARAAQILANANYVAPHQAYDADSLYGLFKDFGALGSWSSYIHIDTGQNYDDVSAMMVTARNQTISATDTTRWGYGVATSDLGKPDLEATIEALRAISHAPCQGLDCLITLNGDVNNSNTVTSADIIGLVGYNFKGGSPPLPCAAAGDVNCSGAVTSADIVVLVNFVFKGGPPPCDICNSSPMVASCN